MTEPRYEVCYDELETVDHLLWSCLLAHNVWALSRGRLQKCSNEQHNFFLLFQQLEAKLETQELERWAVISWAIWNARNKFYFEKTQPHPRQILERTVCFLEEHKRLMRTQNRPQAGHAIEFYCPLQYCFSFSSLFWWDFPLAF